MSEARSLPEVTLWWVGSRATVRTGLPILRGCLSCCLFQEATGQPSSITLYLWCLLQTALGWLFEVLWGILSPFCFLSLHPGVWGGL